MYSLSHPDNTVIYVSLTPSPIPIATKDRVVLQNVTVLTSENKIQTRVSSV